MKNNCTFVSVICADYEATEAERNLIAAAFNPEGMEIKGNELLIPVPNSGLPFGLKKLKALVAPNARVDMFDCETNVSDMPGRIWYCI